jgi:hypothetical protein
VHNREPNFPSQLQKLKIIYALGFPWRLLSGLHLALGFRITVHRSCGHYCTVIELIKSRVFLITYPSEQYSTHSGLLACFAVQENMEMHDFLLCLHDGSRLTYDLAHDADVRGPPTPSYWQTRLMGEDRARYTVILETLTTADTFNFTTRTFFVTIPSSLTSADLVFSWSQVRALPADPTEASNIVCTDTMPLNICVLVTCTNIWGPCLRHC